MRKTSGPEHHRKAQLLRSKNGASPLRSLHWPPLFRVQETIIQLLIKIPNRYFHAEELQSIGNKKSWPNDWEEKEASRTTTKTQGISKFAGIEQQKIQIELLLQQPNIIVGFPHL
jgi:hypothetical protein